MSMGHNPENEDEFVGSGYCRTCRTWWDYLEFRCCSCCSGAAASCRNDECDGVITRSRDMDYSPVEGRLADAHAATERRVALQRSVIGVGL